jgi:flagellin
MAMYINTNVPSLTAQRYLGQTNDAVSKSLERLSSGLRINSASDDASGLAISEKLRGQISGLQRASLNAQDGISLLQTAEGGLQNIQDMLQRMRELAVQAGNGTYTTNDRAEIQKEVDQLKDEINRIANSTEFNTKKLLNGDATALWSASSDKLDVIVKSEVAEGNYNLEVSVDPGENWVYKSNVMTLKDGALGAEIANASANTSNVSSVSNPSSLTAGDYDVAVKAGTANIATAAVSLGSYAQSGSDFEVGAVAISSATTSGYVLVEAAGDLASGSVTLNVTVVDAKTGASTTSEVTGTLSSGGTLTFASGIGNASIALGADAVVQSGDKILIGVTQALTAATGTSAGGSITVAKEGGTGLEVTYDTGLTLAEGANEVTVTYAELDGETGNLNVGSMDFTFDGNKTAASAALTLAGTFKVNVAGAGDVATSTSKLEDLAQFTNADGVNIFSAGPQELKIFGNGEQKSIFIEGGDTIAEFKEKLTNAIVELGMGAEDATVNNRLVEYVSTGDVVPGSNKALAGTFVIQGAKLGDESKLSFIGDQNLINALNLVDIQQGTNSETTIKVTNAHTGKFIGSDKVSDNTLRGVIEGVDVKVDSTVGVNVSWENNALKFTSDGSTDNIQLHLVDNAMKMQIGANEGQTILANIPQINTTSLGIEDVFMVDQDLAQASITKLDKALSTVSGVRATIGSQINRLEYTITGLDTTRENLTAAESRIRDLDIADEMAKFTKNQILMQSNISMLAQANQLPQMALSLLG